MIAEFPKFCSGSIGKTLPVIFKAFVSGYSPIESSPLDEG
jgi:hypothetical protein